jgi:hypothetical protein
MRPYLEKTHHKKKKKSAGRVAKVKPLSSNSCTTKTNQLTNQSNKQTKTKKETSAELGASR